MDKVIEKWDEILNTVKTEHEISDVSFDTWMRPLEVFAVDGNVLYILVPSEQMALSYISKKYYLPLKVAIAEITGVGYEIQFILPEQAKSLNVKKNKPAKKAQNLEDTTSNLNPNYTFETFVVGNNNRFAQSASLAVAESPGEAYNPLYIYGGPGLGKTHLMHSIGHFILEKNPSTKVIYVTSEEFTNEVIESIRNGNASSMTKFRDKYRTVDVLMIDIQFIIGKESTQEEFFHTFNALQTQGKQIILTSDKPPKEMETLEERIRSRFEWGLMADIGVPDYETRMAILRKKAETDNFIIGDEILDYIATNIKSNVRELEGALNKLLAYNNLVNTSITMEIVYLASPNFEIVSEHFHISVDQMISKNRSSEIAKPRQIAMYLCKNMTSSPLDSIGQLLGGRDHSTIIHGIKKVTEEYESNESTQQMIETIKKKINPN